MKIFLFLICISFLGCRDNYKNEYLKSLPKDKAAYLSSCSQERWLYNCMDTYNTRYENNSTK